MSEDSVDHPAYYGGEGNPYECVKVIEAWGLGFRLGNAVKYIGRPGKGNYLQDLKKARWYLDREIAALEKEAGVLKNLDGPEEASNEIGRVTVQVYVDNFRVITIDAWPEWDLCTLANIVVIKAKLYMRAENLGKTFGITSNPLAFCHQEDKTVAELLRDYPNEHYYLAEKN